MASFQAFIDVFFQKKLLGSEDKAFPDPRLGSAVDARSLFLESWILDPDQLQWIHSVLERLSTPGNLPKPPLPRKGIQGRPKLLEDTRVNG